MVSGLYFSPVTTLLSEFYERVEKQYLIKTLIAELRWRRIPVRSTLKFLLIFQELRKDRDYISHDYL